MNDSSNNIPWERTPGPAGRGERPRGQGRRRTKFVAAALFLLLAPGAALATDPGLANVDDILNGRRVLTPISDLVAVNAVSGYEGFGETTYPTHLHGLIMQTENLEVGNVKNLLWSQNPSNCYLNDPNNQAFPLQTRTARMFNLEEDVLVSIAPYPFCGVWNIEAYDLVENKMVASATNQILTVPEWLTSAAGDFDLDGFDDFFVMNGEGAYVVSAKDVNDPTAGFLHGPVATNQMARAPMGEPAVGDFNDDGIRDLAWPAGQLTNGLHPTIRFASVCPGPVPNTVCESAGWMQIVFDPLSSVPIQLPGTVVINQDNFGTYVPLVAVAAADFDRSGQESLFVAYVDADKTHVDAVTYRFDASMHPTAAGSVQVDNFSGYVRGLYATATPLNWFGDGRPQVVLGMGGVISGQGAPYTQRIGVIAVDDALEMTVHLGPTLSGSDANGRPMLRGLAVGLFTDLSESSTQADLNPQIAILTMSTPTYEGGTGSAQCWEVNGQGNGLYVYSVDVSSGTYGLTLESSHVPNLGFDAATRYDNCSGRVMGWNMAGSLLRAGDLQGRSVRIGEPSVVRVSSQTQPFIALGSPPTHVDYIKPGEGSAVPLVINMSALPDTYVSQFSAETDGSNQSSNTQTTSYGYSYKEEEEGEVKFGVPLVSSVTVKTSNAQTQAYDGEVETESNTYASKSFDVSVSTGLSDQVWFTSTQFNVYHYPVFGQTVCPSDNPDCSEDEKRPLMLTFSGPQETSVETISSSALEWYQPVEEPMQIFSYPWSQELLTARITNAQLLSKTLDFFTDDSQNDESIEWSESQGESKTSGSTSSYSFDDSVSVTAGTPKLEEAEGGAKVSVGFTYENSNSTSTLKANVNENGASAGVRVSKPGTFLEPGLYQYKVSPFIFGQTPTDGTVQDIPLSTDVATSGLLQVAYVADPTDPNAGSWWESGTYSQHFDIALNHPSRWDVSGQTGGARNQGDECRFTSADSTNVACAKFNNPDPEDLWNSEFYWMRGLLVTVGGTDGPQRTQATAGDQVVISTRVYNYSLKEMPAGSEVHVQFYRQRWDTSSHAAEGESVLIHENVLAPIPPFNSAANTTAPNWVVTDAALDTTGLGGQSMIFWVLVWAEDGAGNLLTELPGHGLASKPGTLGAIEDAPLEMSTYPYQGQTLTTSFSNNVGFLKMAFYVAPAETSTPASLVAESGDGRRIVGGGRANEPGSLEIELAENHRIVTKLADKLALKVNVRSTAGEREGVVVTMYDGDPDEGGKPFDMEMLGYVAADEDYHVRVPYRGRERGRHELFVVANRGKSDEARLCIPVKVKAKKGSMRPNNRPGRPCKSDRR